MRIIIFIIIISVAFYSNEGRRKHNSNKHKFHERKVVLTPRRYDATCKNFTGGIVCTSCETAQVCDPLGNALKEAKCSDLTSSRTPFCDYSQRACVAEDVCGVRTPVSCRYRSFLPHPSDCRKFLYCEKPGKQPHLYDCPDNTKYSHSRQQCTHDATCVTFSQICKNKPNHWASYPGDESIFLYCFSRGQISEMFTCDDNSSRMLDWGICEYGCKTEGIYPNPIDPLGFTMCIQEGDIIKRKEMKCKEGTVFDYTTQFCAEADQPKPAAHFIPVRDYDSIEKQVFKSTPP